MGSFEPVEVTPESFKERMKYEFRGAWMAGYDYVHVYDDPPIGFPEDQVSLEAYVFPSNLEARPGLPGLDYQYTFKLRDTPDGFVREIVDERD